VDEISVLAIVIAKFLELVKMNGSVSPGAILVKTGGLHDITM
jgi:hypothetical protein